MLRDEVYLQVMIRRYPDFLESWKRRNPMEAWWLLIGQFRYARRRCRCGDA